MKGVIFLNGTFFSNSILRHEKTISYNPPVGHDRSINVQDSTAFFTNAC